MHSSTFTKVILHSGITNGGRIRLVYWFPLSLAVLQKIATIVISLFSPSSFERIKRARYAWNLTSWICPQSGQGPYEKKTTRIMRKHCQSYVSGLRCELIVLLRIPLTFVRKRYPLFSPACYYRNSIRNRRYHIKVSLLTWGNLNWRYTVRNAGGGWRECD